MGIDILGKRQRGMAIPVAIVIILVIATLVLALVLQSRHMGGFHKAVEKKGEMANTADVIKGKMLGVFTGGKSPDPAGLKEMGLSGPPPAPGQGAVPFRGKAGDVEFFGVFNGDGKIPWSTYVPVPDRIDPKIFGYGGPRSPSYDQSRFSLPPNHSLLLINTKTQEQKEKAYYYLISNNSPYGIAAPRGNITLAKGNARAAASPSLAAKEEAESGEKFYLFARDRVKVEGKLTGTAQSTLPRSQKPITLSDQESGQEEEEVPPIPPEELEAILKALEDTMSQMEKEAKDVGIKELAMALLAATATFQGFKLIDLGGFSFDGKNLVWNNSFVAPPRMALLIPFPIKIKGDLLIMDKSTVVVAGNLKVEGRLFVGEGSAVLAGGKMEIEDRVDVYYSVKDMMGINAAIISTGDMKLKKGVRHLKFKPMSGNTGFGFSLISCPFPEYIKVGGKKIKNPAAQAFKKMQEKLLAPLRKSAGILAMFLTGKITIPLGSEDMDMPGLLIASEKGGVDIRDNGKDAGLAGLILCRTGVVIEFPPDGSGVFAGICIALDGNVEFFNVNYRYYPYYSGAAVPLGKGNDSTLLVFPRQHLVSSGEIQN
jgi:hypothetical protein